MYIAIQRGIRPATPTCVDTWPANGGAVNCIVTATISLSIDSEECFAVTSVFVYTTLFYNDLL